MQIGPTVWEEIGDDGQTYGRTDVRTDIIGALYTPTHKIRELIEIYTFPVRFAHRGLNKLPDAFLKLPKFGKNKFGTAKVQL